MSVNTSTSPSSVDDCSDRNLDSPGNELTFSAAVVIALLSAPAVVGNALILATIWRRTFLRTSFHSLLSGLAVTDFLTGLISQPLYCNDRIFSDRVPSCLRSKNTIFHVENLVQQSVNATSSPSVTRKQLLLVLNCNSHLSCPFV